MIPQTTRNNAIWSVALVALITVLCSAWAYTQQEQCNPPIGTAGYDKHLTCDIRWIDLKGASSVEGATFYWSGPSGTGWTGAHLTTNVPGTYILKITAPSGCYTLDTVQLIDDCVPGENGVCWLTGGGSKKSPIVDIGLGESVKPRKLYNWGGNVNPGCSPTAGDGGSWNLIDVAQSLHFHATHIEVVECGNVSGIPPGSTSPVTPFNYIHYTGWGTLKGVKGNKTDMPLVYFWARAEDRNEPGSNGMNDGAGKDRLFVHVYANQANPNGSTLILLDIDGNPATVDPFTISTGNLQLHISSCDDPPAAFADLGAASEKEVNAAPVAYALHANYPNPFNPSTYISYDIPELSNVRLSVFNMLGQEVATLVDGIVEPGRQTVEWNAGNDNGISLPSGVYIYRMQANSVNSGNGFQTIKKMMLMK